MPKTKKKKTAPQVITRYHKTVDHVMIVALVMSMITTFLLGLLLANAFLEDSFNYFAEVRDQANLEKAAAARPVRGGTTLDRDGREIEDINYDDYTTDAGPIDQRIFCFDNPNFPDNRECWDMRENDDREELEARHPGFYCHIQWLECYEDCNAGPNSEFGQCGRDCDYQEDRCNDDGGPVPLDDTRA